MLGRYQDPGDTDLLKLIHEYRYLTRPLLELLAGRKGTSLKRRLRFLFDNHYIWKVHFSRAYTETGSTPDIYVLDEVGREEYERRTGEKADPSPKRNQNRDPQLEHALLINTVRALIVAACEQSDDVELVHWRREGKEARDFITLPDGKKRTIAPDAFFVLRADGKTSPFFLEADRSTMDQPTFARKLQAYYQYYRRIRNELDRNVKPTNVFGIRGFRVLTVIEHDHDWQQARSRDRLAKLISAALGAIGEGKGWKGFWYTSKARLRLDKPGSIFEPIWQVAYKGETEELVSIIP